MSGSGFGATASVCPTDQVTVLNAVVAKIRKDMADIFGNDQTCFITARPIPSVEVSEEMFCTVCPDSSQFDQGMPDGGASWQICENSVFRVTAFTKIALDQMEHETIAFLDGDRGLLVLKKRLLQCLAGQQLYSPAGNPLLLECLRPAHCRHEENRQDMDDFSSFGLSFEGRFFWDLT